MRFGFAKLVLARFTTISLVMLDVIVVVTVFKGANVIVGVTGVAGVVVADAGAGVVDEGGTVGLGFRLLPP